MISFAPVWYCKCSRTVESLLTFLGDYDKDMDRSSVGEEENKQMESICKLCGCTESDSIADAKTLGLQEEFETGVYTCCQIAAWAHEQWVAWFEAANEHANRGSDTAANADCAEEDTVLVPVRFRCPVPWFRRT